MTEASAIEGKRLRNAMGMFATGVTVIATGHSDHVHAMTANAVSSVSLDPPLILICVGKHAKMTHMLDEHESFCVNILCSGQRDLGTYFAGGWKDETPPPFEFVPWEGGMLLQGCSAALGCTVHERLEGGDHWIYLGHVHALHQDEGQVNPLVFYRGRFRELVPEGRNKDGT